MAWGAITGTLSAQTDLNTALSGKAATATTLAGYGITDAQPLDTDLTTWAGKTPYAGTVTVTTGKTFNATGTLTYAGTDGSTLNIGTGGTLGTAAYTASTAYQTADADLTTWAGITPVAAVGTWIATPSSANLRSAVTRRERDRRVTVQWRDQPGFHHGVHDWRSGRERENPERQRHELRGDHTDMADYGRHNGLSGS